MFSFFKEKTPQETPRYPQVQIHIDGYGRYHLKYWSHINSAGSWIACPDCDTFAKAERKAIEWLESKEKEKRELIATIY